MRDTRVSGRCHDQGVVHTLRRNHINRQGRDVKRRIRVGVERLRPKGDVSKVIGVLGASVLLEISDQRSHVALEFGDVVVGKPCENLLSELVGPGVEIAEDKLLAWPGHSLAASQGVVRAYKDAPSTSRVATEPTSYPRGDVAAPNRPSHTMTS